MKYSFRWISIGTGVISMLLLLPCMFKEFNVVHKEYTALMEGNRGRSICLNAML